MKRFQYWRTFVLMGVMIVGGFFIVAKPTWADSSKGCFDQGGTCAYNVTYCAGNQTLITSNSCTSGVCCVNVGTGCTSNGGTCTPTSCVGDDVNLGAMDCPTLSAGAPQVCCRPANVAPPSAAPSGSSGFANGSSPASSAGGSSSVSAPGSLILPACIQSGNCTLNDIVTTGVNFAKFIMGLSGALFFAVFIYGGAMYLLSFGDKGRVDKGKKAITGACIGMFFVLTAWLIVKTLTGAIGYNLAGAGSSGGTANVDNTQCAKNGDGYSCTVLNGTTAQDAQADAAKQGYSCLTGFCAGGNNILCCKQK